MDSSLISPRASKRRKKLISRRRQGRQLSLSQFRRSTEYKRRIPVVKPSKKLLLLSYPLMVIGLGVVFIITRRGSYGAFAPVEEGPLVVFIGILCSVAGIWGLIRTVQEFRKKETEDRQRTTRGDEPDFE